MEDPGGQAVRDSAALAVVHWAYPDGSTVASHPLQLPVAEAVARAYVERYPDRRSWLSVPVTLRPRRDS